MLYIYINSNAVSTRQSLGSPSNHSFPIFMWVLGEWVLRDRLADCLPPNMPCNIMQLETDGSQIDCVYYNINSIYIWYIYNIYIYNIYIISIKYYIYIIYISYIYMVAVVDEVIWIIMNLWWIWWSDMNYHEFMMNLWCDVQFIACWTVGIYY